MFFLYLTIGDTDLAYTYSQLFGCWNRPPHLFKKVNALYYKKMLNTGLKNLCRAFIGLSLFICPSLIYAANVVSVQSVNITPYNDAFKGLASGCNCNVEQFVLSEMQGVDIVKEIRRERPDLIIAVGNGALEKIKSINNIPVVYLMALIPQPAVTGKTNITGISMDIPPDRQLEIIKQILPSANDIGLIYNPGQTGKFVEKAKVPAAAMGIKLTANEARNSKDVPEQLNLMGRVKAFWMLPDVSVMTPETVEILFLYSIKNKVPVITFSQKYLEMGALMSLDIDAYDIGQQAGEIAGRILSGTDAGKIPAVSARKINITVNQRTARKLGINIKEETLKGVKVINRE